MLNKRNIFIKFKHYSYLVNFSQVVDTVRRIRRDFGLPEILNDNSNCSNAISLAEKMGSIVKNLAIYQNNEPMHASLLNSALQNKPLNLKDFEQLNLTFYFKLNNLLPDCQIRINMNHDVCGIISINKALSSQYIQVDIEDSETKVVFINVDDLDKKLCDFDFEEFKHIK